MPGEAVVRDRERRQVRRISPPALERAHLAGGDPPDREACPTAAVDALAKPPSRGGALAIGLVNGERRFELLNEYRFGVETRQIEVVRIRPARGVLESAS